ncbi:hypothetical protein V2G26_003234 [Clonostachys chloroleuca]
MPSNVTPQHHLHELRDPDNGDMRRKRHFAPGVHRRSHGRIMVMRRMCVEGGEFRQKSKSSLSWKRPARCDVIDILNVGGLGDISMGALFSLEFPVPHFGQMICIDVRLT